MQVEGHHARARREGRSAAVDDLDQLLVGGEVGGHPGVLHLRPGEQPRSGLTRELLDTPSHRRGERLCLWRQHGPQPCRDVDVTEQLIDQVGAERGLDLLALQDLAAGRGPVRGVERLAVDPDGERTSESDQRRQDEKGRDDEPVGLGFALLLAYGRRCSLHEGPLSRLERAISHYSPALQSPNEDDVRYRCRGRRPSRNQTTAREPTTAAAPSAPAASIGAIGGSRRTRSGSSNSTIAASAPPISPPMWPPIEIPGTANEKTRLMPIHSGSPLCIGSMPRLRRITTPAPRSPKIAPEAPTVTAFGETISAPNEPARSDTR